MTIHPLPSSLERPGVSAAPLAPETNSEAVEADSKEVLPAPADPLRHDGWTPARQAAFLRELAATHNVAAAARAVGMSRQSAYKLRARLHGTPFDKGWEAAFVTRFDVLAEAALDRALNGVEVPHYYNGELIGTSRRYDERLTLALLAMRGNLVRKPISDFDPSSAFESDDLAALSDRVEQGAGGMAGGPRRGTRCALRGSPERRDGRNGRDGRNKRGRRSRRDGRDRRGRRSWCGG